MGWSFRLARVAGIDLKLHVTFFLILLFGAIVWATPFGLNGALFGVTHEQRRRARCPILRV